MYYYGKALAFDLWRQDPALTLQFQLWLKSGTRLSVLEPAVGCSFGLGPHWLYNDLGLVLCVPSGQGGVPKHHRLHRWVSGLLTGWTPPENEPNHRALGAIRSAHCTSRERKSRRLFRRAICKVWELPEIGSNSAST